MASKQGNGDDRDGDVSVFPLPPGPKRDSSLARQHYLEALLLLQRIDPDWQEWLDGIAARSAGRLGL